MKNFFAFCLLSASLCFGQMTIQFQNQGTPIGTFKKWLPINCTTNLTCAFSGGIITISATGGSATAGGSNTQIQFNSSTALGGISGWTTNGTTTISGAATSVFDMHLSNNVADILLPGALATGCVTVTTSTGAVSSIVCPQTIANSSHKWLNSYTASTGVFTQTQPTLADIAAGTAPSGTFDFSGVTILKGRVGAGLTTSVNGDFGFDTTNFNWHGWNGADGIFPLVPVGTAVNGQCPTWVVSSGNVSFGSAACGAAGANTALSNLASVAVNAALSPGTDNSISLDDLTHRYINGWFSGVLGWTNGSGTADTGLSRDSAGVVDVGNGTAGNSSGTLKAAVGTFGTSVTAPFGNFATGIEIGSSYGLSGQAFTSTNTGTAISSPSVPTRTVTASPVSHDLILCDSSTAIQDRGGVPEYVSTGAGTADFPSPGSSGCGSGFFFKVDNQLSDVTVGRHSGDSTTTLDVYDGIVFTGAATYVVIKPGGSCFFHANSSTNYKVECGAGSLATGTRDASHALSGADTFAAFVPTGGALGTPTSGVITNLTGTCTSCIASNVPASTTFTTPNIGAATGTSLLATGIIDGTAPITITTGTTANLGATYKSGYTFNQEATAGTGVTYTLPATAVGLQYCVQNSGTTGVVNTGILTVYPPSSSYVILNGTVNTVGGGGTHGVASGGAAGDGACFVAIDATHWEVFPLSGTWTEN